VARAALLCFLILSTTMASPSAPQDVREAHSPATSIGSNESSVFEDVSFDYVPDEHGNGGVVILRKARGTTATATAIGRKHGFA
jgi:hypothetical protein